LGKGVGKGVGKGNGGKMEGGKAAGDWIGWGWGWWMVREEEGRGVKFDGWKAGKFELLCLI
jgi:hypothetical protein